MFDHGHYVPILKGKPGEYQALKTLAFSCRISITPLIEIVEKTTPRPSKIPPKNPPRVKSFDEYLKLQSQGISEIRQEQSVFIDTKYLPAAARTASGLYPIQAIVNDLRRGGVKAISVTSLQASPDHKNAATGLAPGYGLCLRITDVFDPALILRVRKFLEEVTITPQEIDLILDFGYVQDAVKPILAAAPPVISEITKVGQWRTLTVASGSFPENLMGLAPDTVHIKPRTDWQLWRELTSKDLERIPTFSDYAIQHPSAPTPGFLGSANIRYTLDSQWAIFRGRKVSDEEAGGSEQYRGLARKVVSHEGYSGEEFSWGDEFIATCARDQGTTGSPTTWRAIGTSHHITYAVRQIANLHDS